MSFNSNKTMRGLMYVYAQSDLVSLFKNYERLFLSLYENCVNICLNMYGKTYA
jgi:hypothetical protein